MEVRDADLIVRCGTVVAAGDGNCRVAMERDRCAGCEGRCAVGLGWLREVELEVASAAPPAVGERVFVGVQRRGMTLAALTAFGLPLAGIAAGAWLGGTGNASAAWVLAGFAAGAALAWAAGRLATPAAWLRPRMVAEPRLGD